MLLPAAPAPPIYRGAPARARRCPGRGGGGGPGVAVGGAAGGGGGQSRGGKSRCDVFDALTRYDEYRFPVGCCIGGSNTLIACPPVQLVGELLPGASRWNAAFGTRLNHPAGLRVRLSTLVFQTGASGSCN